MKIITQKVVDEVIDLYLNMKDNRISTIAYICNLSESSISSIITKYFNETNVTTSKKQNYTIIPSKHIF